MRFLTAFFAVGILAGCGASAPKQSQTKVHQNSTIKQPIKPTLNQRTDPYNSKSSYEFGLLFPKPCGDTPPVKTAAIAFIGVDNQHFMSLIYTGTDWLFLDTKLPMDMLIDGKSTQLMPLPNISRKPSNTRLLTETLMYPVTKDMVSQLAAAQSLQFRVLGLNKNIEQCLSAEDLKTIEAVAAIIP